MYCIMSGVCKGETSFPPVVFLKSELWERGGSHTVAPTVNISYTNQLIPRLFAHCLQFLSLKNELTNRNVAPMLALC